MKLKHTVATFLFVSNLAFSGEVQVTGMYSSMSYNSASGDINGKEIKIVSTFEGLFASVHCASGVPNVVAVVPHEEGFKFALSEAQESALCGINTFYLKPQAENLLLWAGGKQKSKAQVLPRQESYWLRRNRSF